LPAASIDLINLSIGKPKTMEWSGGAMETGIRKQPVEYTYLSKSGFQGDEVANLIHHGGPERAVCIYPFEHYHKWENEYSLTLCLPSFGENITAAGIAEDRIFIGDILQIGEAVVQVSQGRIPCDTISKSNGVASLLRRIVETGFTGYFCRVLQEGVVRKNSQISLLERHPLGVTVLYANHIYFQDRNNKGAIERILGVDALAAVWRDKLSAIKNHIND
jgi:MOSC domain-containing protein YiiM